MYVSTGLKREAHPVNLVQVVRLQDNTADNTSTAGSLHDNLSSAEEEVEVGLDGGSLASLVDSERSTILIEGDVVGSGSPSSEGRFALSEVGRESGGAQGCISRASLCCTS